MCKYVLSNASDYNYEMLQDGEMSILNIVPYLSDSSTFAWVRHHHTVSLGGVNTHQAAKTPCN